MRRDVILQRLQGDFTLPAFPDVLAKLDALLLDADVDVRDVAGIVQTDSVLSGQMLRMANSAYYARGGAPVTNMQAAIQRLGLKALRGLVYAFTLPRLFDGGAFPHKALWKHSLAVAALSGEITNMVGGGAAERDMAYLAGLLHDIGALVLARIDGGYGGFLESAVHGGEDEWDERDVAEIERDGLGIDHAEVGAIFLAERWHVPHPVPLLVRHHHDLGWGDEAADEGLRRMMAILHVANGVCNHAGVAWDLLPTEGRAFRESAWESLGLDLAAVDSLMERMVSSVNHAETLLAVGG